MRGYKDFSYEEFIKFYEDMLDENLSVKDQYKNFLKLKGNMDDKYFEFFNLLFLNSINKSHKLSVFKVLTMNHLDFRLVSKMNNYLETKEDFEKTKENLKNARIRFIKSDVFDLKANFSETYDMIFLSNIFDYVYKKYGYFWTYEDVMPFVENDLMNMLNEDGQIVLGYLFKYYSVARNKGRTTLFSNSSVKSEDFKSVIKTVPIYRLKDGVVAKSPVNDGVVIVTKAR